MIQDFHRHLIVLKNMILDFVILRNGLPIYTMNFDPEKGVSYDKQKFTLISGFFSAIDTFIESVETLGEVSEIKMSTNTLFAFKKVPIPDGLLLFVLTTDEETPKYHRKVIIEEVSSAFISNFQETLNHSWGGNIQIYNSFNQILLEILKKFMNRKKNQYEQSIFQSQEFFEDTIPKNIDSFKSSYVFDEKCPPMVANAAIENEYTAYGDIEEPYRPNQFGFVDDFETNVIHYNPHNQTQFIPSNSPDNHYDQIKKRFSRHQMMKEIQHQYNQYRSPQVKENLNLKINQQLARYNPERTVESQSHQIPMNLPQSQMGFSIPMPAGFNRSGHDSERFSPHASFTSNHGNDFFQRPQYGPREDDLPSLGIYNNQLFQLKPKKMIDQVRDYREDIEDEIQRMVLYMADGKKSITQISQILKLKPKEIYMRCKELYNQGFLQFFE